MQLDQRARQTLLGAARWAIERELGMRSTAFRNPDPDPALREPRASFVTLIRHATLRGRSGTLRVEQPLLDDVIHNACAAGFHAPGFPPLNAPELASLRITISVLSALQPLNAASRADLLRELRPNQDGVMLEAGAHTANFLPAMWQNLPAPTEFLDALMQKAELDAAAWPAGLRVFRYQTDSFREEETA